MTDAQIQEEAKLFWAQVDKQEDGCWLWAGRKHQAGYGYFNTRGRDILAHRYAYALAHLDEVVSEDIHHICHNPPCVRLSHLAAVTHAENCRLNKSRLNESCKNGHLWCDNEVTRKDGTRFCRQCKREQENESRRLFGRSDTKRGRWYR